MNLKPPLHHSITPPLRASLLAALLLSSLIPHPSSFAAESPQYIPFQGQVTNQAGAIVADGQYSVIFNLYDQAVGGQPVWSERHVKVGVTRGMVNVFMGSISPLTAVDISQTKYLGITVDTDNLATTADPEMVPRSLILSAFHSKTAEKMTAFDAATGQSLGVSYGWSTLFDNGNPATGRIAGTKLSDDSVNSGKITNGTIAIDDISVALKADIAIPPGTIMAYAANGVPAGWAYCDGSSQSRTNPLYARLFSVIGTSHGSADAASFNLPDYRGRFLRGVDNGAGNDPDSGQRTAMKPGGNTAGNIGSIQTGATKLPNNPFSIKAITGSIPGLNTLVMRGTTDRGTRADFEGVTDGGDSETRPLNAYVNYIIKL